MQNMPSVMKHDFSKVASANISRSTFNRSHGYKTTLNSDNLYPVFADEILPGDTINLKTLAFGRINTPIFPLMDNIRLSVQYFFVPNRLLWDNWQKFMGEQTNPADSIDYLVPTVDVTATTGYTEQSIYDYLGLPTKQVNLEKPNALHLRAYNKIWNAWYRDENLQDSVTELTGDSSDPSTTYDLLKRNKQQDYFTGCLPWPQKGDSVTLPLGTSAPITGIGTRNQTFSNTNFTSFETDATGSKVYAKSNDSNSTDYWRIEEDPDNAGFPNIRADLRNATAATVNELREAIAIQTLLERSARGGTRYTEIIKSQFNVSSPDARLQRPEFLGSSTSAVTFQEIAQTSETTGTTPQANMSAQGKIMLKDKGFKKSFTEHGVIIGLASIQADLTYQQGLNKMWSRQTRLDYYTPDTAHLGEQAVLNKEIFADGSANDQLAFGYQERWSEMRYFPSIITGLMRSNATASLDPWHLSQEFATLPVLDSDFIEETVPMDRVVAVPSEPDFTLDMYFEYHHERPMPTYSVPHLGTRL